MYTADLKIQLRTIDLILEVTSRNYIRDLPLTGQMFYVWATVVTALERELSKWTALRRTILKKKQQLKF